MLVKVGTGKLLQVWSTSCPGVSAVLGLRWAHGVSLVRCHDLGTATAGARGSLRKYRHTTQEQGALGSPWMGKLEEGIAGTL